MSEPRAENDPLRRFVIGMVRVSEGLGYTLPWANLLDACAGIPAAEVRHVVDDLIADRVVEATPAGFRFALTIPPGAT